MSVAVRHRHALRRQVKHFADRDTVTLRKYNNLEVPGIGPENLSLAIKGTVAIGGTSVDIDATALTGTIRKNSTLTKAGDVTTYVVGVDVIAATNTLTSVTLLPTLVTEATDNDVVTITQDYGTHVYARLRAELRVEELSNSRGGRPQAEHRRLWLVYDSTLADPEEGDFVDDGDDQEFVHEVMRVKPGSQIVGWKLLVGIER